jgi:hypothetical protein
LLFFLDRKGRGEAWHDLLERGVVDGVLQERKRQKTSNEQYSLNSKARGLKMNEKAKKLQMTTV